MANKTYTIFDLGYGRTLIKDDSFYDEVFQVASKITEGTNPSNVGAGETAAQWTMAEGFYQSSNFVSGISGWKIDAEGNAQFNNITLIGGTIKYGKTGFSDSANAGWYVGAEGIYFGAASDASKLKYTIATGVFDFVGTVSGRSTLTISSAIDVSGNLTTDIVNARLNSSTQKILAGFDFGSTNYAGAVLAGNVTWNTTTGAITGGSGVVLYRSGIVGVAAGVTTFSIDAATGDAYFRGNIAALAGYFGNGTNGISVSSNGLDIVGTGYIRTGTSGAMLKLEQSATGGFTHALSAYDAGSNLIFRLAVGGGSPYLYMVSSADSGEAHFINSNSTTTQDTVYVSGAGLQDILHIATSGSGARGAKSGIYIDNSATNGYGLRITSGDDATGALLQLEANIKPGADAISFKDTSWTAVHEARITVENYLQLPAYHHRSDFDEKIAGDTALASSVIANAYWEDGGSTSGTLTLREGTNEDSNTYLMMQTTAASTKTAIMTFARYLGVGQQAVEYRFRLSSLTNTVVRLGLSDGTNYVYCQFDSATHASNLYTTAYNGSGPSGPTATGYGLDTTGWHTFRMIIYSATVMKAWLDNNPLTVVAANIPITSKLKPYLYISNKTSSENKILYLDYAEIWTGRDDTSDVT